MNFGLIIIGDEILSGKRTDKHLPKVIELLSARGLGLSWVRYVGDDPARISADLTHAFGSGDVVFSCGGIGATPDDHTRQCAAAALGVPLALHPQARELILERMRDTAAEQGIVFEPDRSDNVHRLNMGVFPEGAAIIPNPFNKIPGFTVGTVHFVPGFPVMAWPMIEWVLDQHYPHLHGRDTQHEKSVIVFGAMEAALRGHQGIQSAQRRPPGLGPTHRARGEGRGRAARCRVPRAARRAACARREAWP
jgi:molybdopterin-biosynthesis enzyme MoeA-like protein